MWPFWFVENDVKPNLSINQSINQQTLVLTIWGNFRLVIFSISWNLRRGIKRILRSLLIIVFSNWSWPISSMLNIHFFFKFQFDLVRYLGRNYWGVSEHILNVHLVFIWILLSSDCFGWYPFKITCTLQVSPEQHNAFSVPLRYCFKHSSVITWTPNILP